MKIAIQGESGSFHELAAKHWFGENIELVCCDTFSEVFMACADGRADAAVCAIENSLYGSINEVYDLLQEYRFPIIGEVPERIHQNLIALPTASLNDITHVFSHPVALAQCDAFLAEHLPNAEKVQHQDTAASVAYIKEQNNIAYAAIASSVAAKQYEMQILRSEIEDHSTNYTRFLILNPKGSAPSGANKTSLTLQTNHTPGSLYKALGVLANANVNMTKLQSRPITGKVWKYQFYLDIETAGDQLITIIKEMTSQGCEVTVLGEYKAADLSYED